MMAPLQVSLLFIINFCVYTIKSLNTYESDNETCWKSTSDFIPQYATYYGYIRIGKEMRMEFDFIFHGRTQNDSWVFESYFRIGFDSDESSSCDGENSRYPAMFLRNNDNRVQFSISDSTNCGHPYNIYDQLIIGQSYHILIYWNQTNVHVLIDGHTYINKLRDPTIDQFLGEYAKVWISSDDDSNPTYPPGNGTLSNIRITSNIFPTYSPTNKPTIEPTQTTNLPTYSPTNNFCAYNPTTIPTVYPTEYPSDYPSELLTNYPTINPTINQFTETNTSIIRETNTSSYLTSRLNTSNNSFGSGSPDPSSSMLAITLVALISAIICLFLIILAVCLIRRKHYTDNKSPISKSSVSTEEIDPFVDSSAAKKISLDDEESKSKTESSDMFGPGKKKKYVEGGLNKIHNYQHYGNHTNTGFVIPSSSERQEGTQKKFIGSFVSNDDNESIESMYQPPDKLKDLKTPKTPLAPLISSNTLRSINKSTSNSTTPGATRRGTGFNKMDIDNGNDIDNKEEDDDDDIDDDIDKEKKKGFTPNPTQIQNGMV